MFMLNLAFMLSWVVSRQGLFGFYLLLPIYAPEILVVMFRLHLVGLNLCTRKKLIYFVCLWINWHCRNLFVYGTNVGNCSSSQTHFSFDWANSYLEDFKAAESAPNNQHALQLLPPLVYGIYQPRAVTKSIQMLPSVTDLVTGAWALLLGAVWVSFWLLPQEIRLGLWMF